jgi:hypothetical protein
VIGKALHKDTPLMNLWADAELLAADQTAGYTNLSIVAQGVLRADFDQGKTGVISFGDIFRAVPLGVSEKDGSLGYPLCRTYLLAGEVKAAFEVAAGYAYTSTDANDLLLSGGGIQVVYDTSLPIFDSSDPYNYKNGRVTKMTLATDHTHLDVFDKVIFDVNLPGGYVGAINDVYTVTANSYVVQFANQEGVTLKDMNGNPQMPIDTIMHRSDGTEVKDFEAMANFLRAQPNMTVPTNYQTATHMVCNPPPGTPGTLCQP